jgi:hypothetical protein
MKGSGFYPQNCTDELTSEYGQSHRASVFFRHGEMMETLASQDFGWSI